MTMVMVLKHFVNREISDGDLKPHLLGVTVRTTLFYTVVKAVSMSMSMSTEQEKCLDVPMSMELKESSHN